MDRPAETRERYPHLFELATRWADNDVYGHVNNATRTGLDDDIAEICARHYVGSSPYLRPSQQHSADLFAIEPRIEIRERLVSRPIEPDEPPVRGHLPIERLRLVGSRPVVSCSGEDQDRHLRWNAASSIDQ